MDKSVFLIGSFLFVSIAATAQNRLTKRQIENNRLDSLYIEEVEDNLPSDKVLHAEPLYIDLIRDLGARKGEHEWNLGLGITDNHQYDYYTALLEYEFAPVDRLGLEVEVPFSLYYPNTSDVQKDSIPASKLNSLKLAAQYSFFVSELLQTSMAIGYINEIMLTEFNKYNNGKIVLGNGFNPFFVAARRWGNNFHTLLYTGPAISHYYGTNQMHTEWEVNSNFHYMVPGTRNFIGVEFNKVVKNDEAGNADFAMTIRPQMRLSISDNLLVGIVAGVPVSRNNERFSSFVRLIYEPRN